MQTLPRGVRERSGSYFIDITVKGKRYTETCASLRQAAERVEIVRSALKSGKAVEKSGGGEIWTLKQAFDFAFDRRWKQHKSERTAIFNCQDALKYFGEEFPMSELTTEAVDGYVMHLENKGNADGTINRKISRLNVMFKMAQDRKKTGDNTGFKYEHRRETQGRIRWMDRDEEDRLLANLERIGLQEHADVVRVAIDTGFRMGEIWRLKPFDVDMATGRLTVWENKTDKPRSIVMTSRVKTVLMAYEKSDNQPYFPRSKEWLIRGWNRAKHIMKLNGDAEFIPYCCRHTCCSRLVMGGVPLIKVQQWMGHRSIQTTLRYAHLAPDYADGMVNILER